MKLIIQFIFLITCLSNSSFSQSTIAEIKNDSDVIRFVQGYSDKYNLKWENVGLDISQNYPAKYFKEDQIHFTDSVTKVKWIKADFNSDGKEDLIFNGTIYFSQMAVLAFITEADDSVTLHYLGNILSMSKANSISQIKNWRRNLLEVGMFGKRNEPGDYIRSYEKDTLIYKYSGFVEYNRRDYSKIDFDSIYFKISSPWGIRHSPTRLWIYKDGSIKLFQEYNQINDSLTILNNYYNSKISEEQFAEIQNILGYINFQKLNANYSLYMVSDLTTSTLVVYAMGKEKRIIDYGMCGTYGLGLLYSKFLEIMKKNKLGNR